MRAPFPGLPFRGESRAQASVVPECASLCGVGGARWLRTERCGPGRDATAAAITHPIWMRYARARLRRPSCCYRASQTYALCTVNGTEAPSSHTTRIHHPRRALRLRLDCRLPPTHPQTMSLTTATSPSRSAPRAFETQLGGCSLPARRWRLPCSSRVSRCSCQTRNSGRGKVEATIVTRLLHVAVALGRCGRARAPQLVHYPAAPMLCLQRALNASSLCMSFGCLSGPLLRVVVCGTAASPHMTE